jgi:hypothetical protein
MLDLRLLRVPTFGGGLAAAWAISASIFSALTFLVLYLQNTLGLSAVATGVRFLPLTGAIFLTAGIAGVAALGSLFASQVRSSVTGHLAGTPLAAHAQSIAHGISTGGAAHTIAAAPAPLRELIAGAARGGFVSGLNEILLIGGIVAFAGALASLALIRERDFITSDAVPVAV